MRSVLNQMKFYNQKFANHLITVVDKLLWKRAPVFLQNCLYALCRSILGMWKGDVEKNDDLVNITF